MKPRGARSGAALHRPRSHRRAVGAATIAVLVAVLLGVGGIAVTPGSEVGLPQAHATPAPGEPGGNHSKPGDNKKKKRNDNTNNNRNNNGGLFDRGGSDTQRPDSQPSQQRQPPQSRIDATQIDQTDRNNRLTPDGSNRSVGIQTGDDGAARQGPPDEQPANVNPAEAAEQAAEARDGIPLQSERLSPDLNADYRALRRAVPTWKTQRLVDRQVASGELDYNKNPFGLGETNQKAVADHLIPVRRLYDIPGFSELDRQTQIRIADDPQNIIATTPMENASRGSRTFAEYPGLADGTPLDPGYRDMRIAQEAEVYPHLVEQVNEAWAQQFPGQSLPSATNGPLELPAQAPPLEVPLAQNQPEIPVVGPLEIPPVQAAPEIPVTPPPVDLPANPVPPMTNYPLPPVSPATPPIVGNPGPAVIGTALPPVPQVTPPAVADPVTPDIGVPVSPLDVLFPGVQSAPPPTLPESIIPSLPSPAATVPPPEPTTITRLPNIPRVLGDLVKVPGGNGAVRVGRAARDEVPDESVKLRDGSSIARRYERKGQRRNATHWRRGRTRNRQHWCTA